MGRAIVGEVDREGLMHGHSSSTDRRGGGGGGRQKEGKKVPPEHLFQYTHLLTAGSDLICFQCM